MRRLARVKWNANVRKFFSITKTISNFNSKDNYTMIIFISPEIDVSTDRLMPNFQIDKCIFISTKLFGNSPCENYMSTNMTRSVKFTMTGWFVREKSLYLLVALAISITYVCGTSGQCLAGYIFALKFCNC